MACYKKKRKKGMGENEMAGRATKGYDREWRRARKREKESEIKEEI